MINNVVLLGRLCADPELKKTSGDVSVCSFRIAVDRKFKDDKGERQADFINCVAWRERAEFVAKYFAKGAAIGVVGTLQSRQYDDKDGNKRTAYEVVCEQVSFTGESKKSEATPSVPGFAPPKGKYDALVDDDDAALPF